MSKQTIYLGLIQGSSILFPWLYIVLTASILGLDDAGLVSLMLAILAPIIILASTPGRNYLLTSEAIVLIDYLGSRLILLVIFGAVVALYSSFQLGVLVFLIFMVKFSELLFEWLICEALREKDIKALLNQLIVKVIGLLLFAVLMLSSKSLILSSFVLFIYFTVVFTYMLFNAENKLNLSVFKFSSGFNLLFQSLPFSMAAVVFSFESNMVKYVMGYGESNVLLAVYSIAFYIVILGSVVLNVLLQSRLHEMSKSYFSGTTNSKIYTESFLVVGLIYFSFLLANYVGLVDFYMNLSGVSVGNEASELVDSIVYTSVAFFLFSVSNYLLSVRRMYKQLLIIALVSLVIVVLSTFGLFKLYGDVGAVYGFALGVLFHSFLIFHTYKKI